MSFNNFTGEAMSTLFILLLFVTVPGGIGLHRMLKYKRFRSVCTEETTGKVIDIYESPDSEGSTYYPIFEYVANGQTVIHKSSYGSNWKRFKIGTKVTVFFNPANIDEYYVKEDTEGNYIGILFMVFGAVMLIIMIIKIFKIGYGLT